MIVDNFAGGGGASTGIEMAVGRSPDVAINHDPEALAMHRANHPHTRHYATDVFEIDPRVVVRDKRVGLAWFSPDCTHHSKARGGKPIREHGKKSRGLAWVVVKWARICRPRVIMLENVEEFAQWGPLIKTESGFKPCPARRGNTFRRWVRKLELLGYRVEWKELRACDYGSPTIRKRLFVIARCDGQPIVWPKQTHGRPDSEGVVSGRLKPWRTAAEIIDWSLRCPSIFMSPEEAKSLGIKRPLAENTLKRIAAGLKRYVLESASPFIVSCNHGGDWFRGRGIDQPFATVTGSKGDALVAPFVQSYHGETVDGTVSRSGELIEPIRTVDTQNRHGMVQAFLAQHNTGVVGHSANKPLSTITGRGTQQQLVSAGFTTYGHQGGSNSAAVEPLHTISASDGDQNAIVESSFLSHNYTSNTRGGSGDPRTPLKTVMAGGQHHMQVKAFLQKYYGTGGQDQDCREPLHTVPSSDRFGVVRIDEVEYQIVDIGMRMLTARELFRAQGFPDSYKIDVPAENKRGVIRPLPKDAQVRMCGNSVCPQVAAAIVAANCKWLRETKPAKRERQLELAGV